MHTDYVHKHAHAIQINSDSFCLLKSTWALAVPKVPASEGTESTSSVIHTQSTPMVEPVIEEKKDVPPHPQCCSHSLLKQVARIIQS